MPRDQGAERADGQREHERAEAAGVDVSGQQLQGDRAGQQRGDHQDGRDDARTPRDPVHQLIVSGARPPVNADRPHWFGG
jgi:hypothetical protein